MNMLSTTEVARATGKSRVTIQNWCRDGKIASERDPVSGSYKIPETALEPYKVRNLLKGRKRSLLTVPQAAKILGRTTGDITALIRARAITYVRLPDNVIRIDSSDLDAFIEARKERAAIPAMTSGSI